MFSLFRRKAAPAKATAQASFVTAAPLLNAGGTPEGFAASEWRFGAICRDREQRKADGEPKHRDHDSMTAEALGLAAQLLHAGIWTRGKYNEMVLRLGE